MKKLDIDSLVFMADLLNCMLDDINYTILVSNDPDLIKLLDYISNRLNVSFQRLTNFNVSRGYYD